MMKPYYSSERAKWGLRSSHKPRKGTGLSGTVLVIDDQGKGYAYLAFTDEFVEAVGKALPMGVGPEHPAYLRVVRSGANWKETTVFAVYEGADIGVPLVQYPKDIDWLGTIHRGER